MFSDEYLEYWAKAYAACHLFNQGIVFHEFLVEPWRYLRECGLQWAPVSLELGYRRLLPRQMTVARELWKRWTAEDAREKPSPRTQDSGYFATRLKNSVCP